jgi:hypothetical protein
MSPVEAHELKSLVDAGTYRVDAAQIASAMLERRGIRELLTGVGPQAAPGGQTPPAPVVRPRAA